MKRLLLALAVIAGCDRGTALDGTCITDSDCQSGGQSGGHCIAGTGVCERFTTPLDDDGGAPNRPATDAGTGARG